MEQAARSVVRAVEAARAAGKATVDEGGTDGPNVL